MRNYNSLTDYSLLKLLIENNGGVACRANPDFAMALKNHGIIYDNETTDNENALVIGCDIIRAWRDLGLLTNEDIKQISQYRSGEFDECERNWIDVYKEAYQIVQQAKEAKAKSIVLRGVLSYEEVCAELTTLERFLLEVQLKTADSKETVSELLHDTMEELGEFAAAITIESGRKQKPLTESSKIEAVDVTICALSLFFASGGDINQLIEIGTRKLEKWQNRINKQK